MRLGILHNRRQNGLVTAPLGLQVETAVTSYATRILLGPREVLLRLDYHLQLMRPSERLVQRWMLTLRRETHPVKLAAEGVRTRCLEKYRNRAVSGPNGYNSGSPPVITIDCAAHALARATTVSTSTGGYMRGFHVYLASHHLHPTSHPPKRMKYAGLPVW